MNNNSKCKDCCHSIEDWAVYGDDFEEYYYLMCDYDLDCPIPEGGYCEKFEPWDLQEEV